MKLLSIISLSLLTLFITACTGISSMNESTQNINNKFETVIVYKNTGKVQCEFKGYTPEQTALELTKNGIEVIESNCGSISGMMNISVCGAGTSSVNIFRIDAKNLESAISLGFSSPESLDKGLSLEIGKCH